jgi:hypothetical protein
MRLMQGSRHKFVRRWVTASLELLDLLVGNRNQLTLSHRPSVLPSLLRQTGPSMQHDLNNSRSVNAAPSHHAINPFVDPRSPSYP